MEYLVALFQTTEDRNSVLNAWLVNHNRLETSFECRIFLDVLTVFVECCSADTVELAPCQHRLQQVACVHSAIGLACTDDSVKLINKQKYLTVAVLYLIEDSLQTLLELAAVLCSCDESSHIK